MIVAAAFLLLVLAVPATGGELSRLGGLRLRWWGLAIGAVAVQVVLLSWLPDSVPWGAAVAIHLATYGLALAFVVRNQGVPGLWLIALGGALNLVAIAANGGVMPATAAALELAGQPVAPGGFANSMLVDDPHLVVLGDVFAVPGPGPFGNVFSVGDVLLVVGGGVLVHTTCRRRGYAGVPVTAAQPASSAGRNKSGRVTHTA